MPDALCVGNFLSSDEQKYFSYGYLMGMHGQVYQVLEKTDRLSEGHYTILVYSACYSSIKW
jgi:hypothetical protein